MEVNQYTCKKCDYSMDHPIDSCPVCGAIFYWLIRTKQPVNELVKSTYLSEMSELMDCPIDPVYVFHGGKIWLPHSFWHRYPGGDPLSRFPWIHDLQLVQYKKNAGESKTSAFKDKTDMNVFDTNPQLPVIKKQPSGIVKSASDRVPVTRDSPVTSVSGLRSALLAFRGPVSVGLFFVLMALAYFTICLGVQKNAKHEKAIPELPAIGSEEMTP